MSVVDKVRSFAETRCRDTEVVPCGFTYGDMRELLAMLSEPTDAQRVKVCQEIWDVAQDARTPMISASLTIYENRVRARMAKGAGR